MKLVEDREAAPPRGGRILVVDDELANRVLLEAILVPEGYEIAQAEDARSAMAIVSRGETDLVLLDVLMPGVDGIEMCRRIRRELGLLHLPIIVITALHDREARRRGKEAGADDFMMKPIDDVELKARVKNLLAVKAYHDLRERQRAAVEKELEAIRAQLLRADRLATLGSLAAGVGHELRNLCTVLQTAVHYVDERARAGLPPEPEDLAVLHTVRDHLRTHATHLLEIGRPAADTVEPVDLGALAKATVAILRKTGRLTTALVEVTTPDQPAWVVASRTRLEQVLVNLLCNAADAVAGVAGADGRGPHIALDVYVDGDAAVCVIEDNGVGISAQDLPRIFEPYFTTKPPERGTGLGLPVVRRILESFSGSIAVESREGVGTTVTIELPCTIADAPPLATLEPRAERVSRGG